MSRLGLSSAFAERLLRSGYRVLITGASGWLGRASLEMLSGVYGELFTERVKCFGSSRRTLQIQSGLAIDQRPLGEMSAIAPAKYILLHFACLTKDKVASMSLDEYLAGNRTISRMSMEAAAEVGVERVLLVSSGAVYQALTADGSNEREHPYAAIKLEDEALFRRFAYDRAGTKVLTVRLFNLGGRYINKVAGYALSSFIEQARERGAGSSIRINADHPVIRSYVGVGDLLNVAFAHLLDESTDTYDWFDTAGDCEVEVLGLAERVRAVVNPSISITRAALTSTEADRYVGDGTKFRFLASRYGLSLQDLDGQVRETAEYLGAL
jgi:nucleoside-diphosphate-sugar epimerase